MLYIFFIFFFKQKTAYEMRISDWSSDVCSSDLVKSVDIVAFPEILFELVRCLLGARQFEGEAQDDSPGPDAGKQQSQHDHLHHDISLHEQGQRRNGRSLSHQGYGDRKSTRLNSSH